jgi:hypothetical protein
MDQHVWGQSSGGASSGAQGGAGGVAGGEHTWALSRLLARALGLLDETDGQRLATHLSSCDPCRSEWDGLWAAEGAARERPGHVPAGLIARWDRIEPALRGLERELVLQHVARCVDCRDDLALAGFAPAGATAQAGVPGRAPLGFPRGPAPRRGWIPWVMGGLIGACTTATVALLVLWPTLMSTSTGTGIVGHGVPPAATGAGTVTSGSPGTSGGASRAAGAAGAASSEVQGLVVPWVAPSSVRGAGTRAILAAEARALTLTLAVPPELDRGRPAAVEVRGPDDGVVARIVISPPELQRSTLLVLLQASAPFAPGSYRVLLWSGSASAAGTAVHETAFDVQLQNADGLQP